MAYVKIIEKDVDGCGEDAVQFVSFPRDLTEKESEQLSTCLKVIKENWTNRGEDLDTGDMIQEALEIFTLANQGPVGTLCFPPYSYELTF